MSYNLSVVKIYTQSLGEWVFYGYLNLKLAQISVETHTNFNDLQLSY